MVELQEELHRWCGYRYIYVSQYGDEVPADFTDLTYSYPLPIPENSAFPAWAYLNGQCITIAYTCPTLCFIVTGGFNEAAAQADSSAYFDTMYETQF